MEPNEIRNAREALGLTQEALGERLGRHKDTIRAWESGKYEIDASASLALRLVVRLVQAGSDTSKAALDGLWRGA